ncbi:MAG TPA: pyroglutamyl-peptidase I [Candidatus Fimimorpha faecalis]|mgnify:FL=1|uniref:Pyrrolidone-carboxylate peptidase n=1 Tax=Candidatus Fimimorpha faecalis TaxID=2840824 RepID=A0A9D1JDP6_9FIRM|nr:pyroglutamyl-peptidase I [Candidatus Fimimorpha faecalis]
MKILVTGFDPFGGETVNPAYEAVKMLPEQIAGAEIIKLEIPTVFSKSSVAVEEGIQKYNPDIVINVGQAGGRSHITIEQVAINLADARIPDNAGEQPLNEALQPDGDTAYFATVPIRAMVKHVQEHGLPCSISYTAGTYVCNCVMYNVLYMTQKKYPNIKAGFIHVPFATSQLIGKPATTPGMSLDEIEKSLEYAIEAVVLGVEEEGIVTGQTH